MSTTGLRKEVINQFWGPVLTPQADATDLSSGAILAAENVSFGPGYIETRSGHEQMFVAASGMKAFYNWITDITGAENRLVSVSGDRLIVRNMQSGVETVLMDPVPSTSGVVKFQHQGNRIYFSIPGGPCRTWTGMFTNGIPDIGPISPAPPTLTGDITEQSGGSVTQGKHLIGLAFVSKSGNVGKLVTGYSIETAGNTKIRAHFPFPNVPAWVGGVKIAMTTVDNPERYYFIPGGHQGLIGGAPNHDFTFFIDLPDSQLSNGREAIDNEFYLSGDNINVDTICAYGNRMVYVSGSKVYISEAGDYEAISDSLHLQMVPGEHTIKAVAPLRGVLYLGGEKGIWALSDNYGTPATWGSPVVVSDRIGVPGPECLVPNTEAGYMWAISEGGLYVMDGGRFGDVPVTLHQTPLWSRINWKKAGIIRTLDDTKNQRLLIAVPLDDATTLTHIICVYYEGGKDQDSIRLSLDRIAIPGFSIGSIGPVKNPATGRTDVCIAPASSGPFLRRYSPSEIQVNPASTRADHESPIESSVSITVAPTPDLGNNDFREVEMRLTGMGFLSAHVSSLDGKRRHELVPVLLEDDPGKAEKRRFFVRSPRISLNVSKSSKGEWFRLSSLTAKWKRAPSS